MRRDRFWTFLLAAGLGTVIAYGSLRCLITGFQMEVSAGQGGLLLFCLLCGVLAAGFLSLRHGGWVLLGLGLLTGVFCMQDILYGIEVLLCRITTLYNAAYGWDILQWSGKPMADMPADGAILTLAATITVAVCWVMCRKRRAFWALIPTVLPVAACMVVTDTVPEEHALFLLIFGCVLLILTQTVRRRNAADGNRLMAILLIPCLLLSTLLFAIAPREGYEANGNPLQNAVLEWLQKLPFAPGHNGNGIGTSVLDGEEVDLSDVGDRDKDERIVMEVAGARPGLFYLRGQSYDVYTGKSWEVADLQIKDLGWTDRNGTYLTTVKIQTKDIHDQMYFPYYAESNLLRNGLIWGKMDNVHGIKNYEFNQYSAVSGNNKLDLKMEQQCLDLPSDTKKNAGKILEEIFDGQSLSYIKKAEVIGDYVRGQARYDLKTDKMPNSEKDFAIWFLENGKTGYCVHYASAAVVLLRTAGIPARYVTGYVSYASAGTSTVITGEEAHAWVEYYAPSAGWKVLEVTPSEGLPQRPTGPVDPRPTDPTRPTTPTEPNHTTDSQNQPTTEQRLPTPTVGPGQTNATTTVRGGNEDKTPAASQMPPWLLLIPGGLGGAVLLVWLQFVLRCRRRKKQASSASAKRRAVVRWQYVQRLSRVLKTLPPKELLALAEKAAFSQHKLTREELNQFDSWIRNAEQAVRKKSFSLLLRLIWAID